MNLKFALLILGLIYLIPTCFSLPLIFDGSFEQNCGTTRCDYNSSQLIGDDWNYVFISGNSATGFRIDSNTGQQTDGNYVGILQNSSGGINYDEYMQNTQLLKAGLIYFDVPKHSNGFHETIRIYSVFPNNSTTLLYNSLVKDIPVGNDKNVVLTNKNQYIRFEFFCSAGGSCAGNSNIYLDNIRYDRYPILDTGYDPFIEPIFSGQSFRMKVDYQSGGTCVINNITNDVNYSTIYEGNERYITGSISFDVNSGDSVTKNFRVVCDGKWSSNPSWNVKINKHNLISSDGSFEKNCSSDSCNYDSNQIIGSDWEYLIHADLGGVPTFQLSRSVVDISSTNVFSSGNYYATLTSPYAGNQDRINEIRTTGQYRGGFFIYDILSNSTATSVQYQIIFYPQSGGSRLLKSVQLNVDRSGNDFNVSIPTDQNGKIGIKLINNQAGAGGQAYLLFDNIRHLPLILDNNITESSDPTLPDQNFYIYNELRDLNGNLITDADVNIVFNGIQYNNFDYNSTLGKYVWSHSEHNQQTYEYTVKSNRNSYIGDTNTYGTITVYSNPDSCVPVIYNGDPSGKIDVTFIGSGFPDLTSFAKTVDEMIDYNGTNYGLMSLQPFKNYRTSFNFWKVNTIQTFGGGLIEISPGQFNHDRTYELSAIYQAGITCGVTRNDELITLLVQPVIQSHSYKIPLTNIGGTFAFVTIGNQYLTDSNWSQFNIRNINPPNEFGSAGSSKNDVIRTLMHEFGHSFGGLEDEFNADQNVDDENSLSPTFGIPNCDDNIIQPGINYCDKWSSIDANACVPGCGGYFRWHRPYKNSIMEYQFFRPYPDFNRVSEHELEKDINNMTGIGLLSTPSFTNYNYILDLNYSQGAVTFSKVSLIQNAGGTKNVDKNISDYRLQVISKFGEDLYDSNFTFPLSASFGVFSNWFDENGNQIFFPGYLPIHTYADANISLAIPQFNTAERIDIFDQNANKILSIDVSMFSTKLNYSLGYGADQNSDQNYMISYEITPQPIGILTSTNYVCRLGTKINQ